MEKHNSFSSTLARYAELYDRKEYEILNEEMSFEDYLEQVRKSPKLARNSFQYVYDMILAKGTSNFERYRKTYTRYHFFDDPEIPIFGLEETLSDLVDFVHGAAGHYGTERRILLLHGPVGSSKSTICRRLKRGLEQYSRTEDGRWYTFRWVNLPTEDDELGPMVFTTADEISPLNEQPLKLMPKKMRDEFLKDINQVHRDQTPEDERVSVYDLVCEGELNPRCKLFMGMLLRRYKGDWLKVIQNHVRVIRRVHSEVDRIGIGTFQPKDEKNQDSTELTGDMNYRLIAQFGSDSDPRSFNFDGEFEVANRGVVEFIEGLKLANEFLYDLLGVSQEHQIKPKKFAQVVVDEFALMHTNNPEFEKLKSNEFMEALRDRTVKVDVPYLTRLSEENKIYEHQYGPKSGIKTHIMPHTLEICGLFAVLSRLEDEGDNKLDLRDKAKLYDGQALPGWTEDSVKELRDRHPDEGMKTGLSARFIQDALANCLARNKKYVNVFHVMSELKSRLRTSSLISDVDDIKRYEVCAELAIKELDEILKTEVQKALVADDKAAERMCQNYIDHVVAYVNDEKMINPITKQPMEPNERLMRSIEEKIGISNQGADDFRISLTKFIGSLAHRKKEFRWDSNPELKRAIEAKLFEDVKDTVKLSTLTKEAAAVDPELQEKIDLIKTRLIKNYGYNDQSASDVLEYVSSIYSRGDTASQ